jgi:hypothetical protein
VVLYAPAVTQSAPSFSMQMTDTSPKIPWCTCNFTVHIDNVDCRYVIDSDAVVLSIAPGAPVPSSNGFTSRSLIWNSGKAITLKFKNSMAEFINWLQTGNLGKTGSVSMLDPGLKSVLGQVSFSNLQVQSITSSLTGTIRPAASPTSTSGYSLAKSLVGSLYSPLPPSAAAPSGPPNANESFTVCLNYAGATFSTPLAM